VVKFFCFLFITGEVFEPGLEAGEFVAGVGRVFSSLGGISQAFFAI